MTTPSPKKQFSLLLVVLLIMPAVPTIADDSARASSIDLHLEQALALQGATFDLGETPGGGTGTRLDSSDRQVPPESNSDASHLMSLNDSSMMHEVAAEELLAGQVRQHYGFGRWLKKYWYVPVLAAAAVVAVSDDGSDSPDDID